MKYRKKPVVVEAVQWTGENLHEILCFIGCTNASVTYPGAFLAFDTLEGNIIANSGDYIIKGVNDEFYPCKPDIFKKTYELAE